MPYSKHFARPIYVMLCAQTSPPPRKDKYCSCSPVSCDQVCCQYCCGDIGSGGGGVSLAVPLSWWNGPVPDKTSITMNEKAIARMIIVPGHFTAKRARVTRLEKRLGRNRR